MNRKFKICLNFVGLLFALGCANTEKNTGHNNVVVSPEDSFKSYYDTLNLMKIPVRINWQYWDSTVQRYMSIYGPIKSSGILENPLAKVFGNKNYKAIIFVSPDETGSPALVTIDRNDSPIDTVFLLGDISSNNPEQWTIEEAEIVDNYTIQLLDSVSRWKVGMDGERIPNSKETTIEIKKYKISESGKIAEIN